jgi:hypothetical protein
MMDIIAMTAITIATAISVATVTIPVTTTAQVTQSTPPGVNLEPPLIKPPRGKGTRPEPCHTHVYASQTHNLIHDIIITNGKQGTITLVTVAITMVMVTTLAAPPMGTRIANGTMGRSLVAVGGKGMAIIDITVPHRALHRDAMPLPSATLLPRPLDVPLTLSLLSPLTP